MHQHLIIFLPKLTLVSVFIVLTNFRINPEVWAQENDSYTQCAQKELAQKPYLIDRFSMQQLVADCRMQMEWAEKAERKPTKFSDDTLTSSQRDWLNRLRSCQGSQCLTDVVNCTLKRCRSKPFGAAWTPDFVQTKRNGTSKFNGPSFADFGLQADNLATVNLSVIDDQFLSNEDDNSSTCRKREKVAQMCHVILKAQNATEALRAIEAGNLNSTRPKFMHDFEKSKYPSFKTKCQTLVDNLAKQNLTLYHVKPCPDGTEPPIGTKNGSSALQTTIDYCFKILRAKTPGDAFPEQFEKAKEDELKVGRLLARYGQWLERCRRFKDLLAQNNVTLEKMTTLKFTREPYSAKTPPMQRRFWADKKHPKSTSPPPKNRKKRQVTSSQPSVSATTVKSDLERLIKNQALRSSIDDLFADAPSSPMTRNDQRAVRKEYRMMTDQERSRYHAAVNRLKMDRIDGVSKYELFIRHHSPQEAPEAHFSAAFLPYHRELLKQFEVALRSIDATVSVPYWDSRMDHDLPDPRDSIVWTDKFFGNAQGYVTTGPYANWLTTHAYKNQFVRLYREAGQSMQGALFNESFIREAITSARYDDLVYWNVSPFYNSVRPDFELAHGGVHMWVGGHMFDPPVSPNDPVFFSHHAFVDFVFEEFRQRQRPQERQTYNGALSCPTTRGSDQASLPMWPFRLLRNIDGMSNRYAELYAYQQRPVCSRLTPTCSSPYLFCDTRSGYRCVSKIRPGGNCKGFEGTNICFQGLCPSFSICPKDTSPQQQKPQPQTQTPLVPVKRVTQYRMPTTRSTVNLQPWKQKNRQPMGGEFWKLTTVRPMPQNQNPWQRNSGNVPGQPSSNGNGFPRQSQNHVAVPPEAQIFFTCTVASVYGGLVDAAGIEISSFQREKSRGVLVHGTGFYPTYGGGAVLSARNPDTTPGGVNVVTVEVRDRYGRICQPKCYEPRWRSYAPCHGQFRLSNDQRSADPIQLSRTQQEALAGMWMQNGNNIYRLPDYCRFECM